MIKSDRRMRDESGRMTFRSWGKDEGRGDEGRAKRERQGEIGKGGGERKEGERGRAKLREKDVKGVEKGGREGGEEGMAIAMLLMKGERY